MKLQIQKGDTLDSSKVVFPIGKLKGRNLYELMENEPEKLKWFVNQQFFKEKYSNIYNIIINGSNDIKDSKEHNEIVQMFYDYDFLLKFYLYEKGFDSQLALYENYINIYTESLKKDLHSVYNKYKIIYKHYLYAIDFCNDLNGLYDKNNFFIENNNRFLKKGMYANLLDTKSLLEEIKANLEIYKENFYKIKDELKLISELEPKLGSYSRIIRTESSMNDIVLEDFNFKVNFIHDRYYKQSYSTGLSRSYKIEIKPIVGEDYPDVLRQCKRQNTDTLLIKDFVCESTTIDTLKEMFHPIDIIILNDVLKIEVIENQ